MQENENNASIPENDISLYKGENREILEKLQERMNVVFNPSLKTARYVPSAEHKGTVLLCENINTIEPSLCVFLCVF